MIAISFTAGGMSGEDASCDRLNILLLTDARES